MLTAMELTYASFHGNNKHINIVILVNKLYKSKQFN